MGRQFGSINFGAFGVFSDNLSNFILVLSMFPINQPLFLQTIKSLYVSKSQIHLSLGFEFGPQTIRDLAICVRSP